MLFDQRIIHELMSCAHWADRLVKADLIDGYIVSENDYTSNFTGALRREITARNIDGLSAKIQVLNASAEREMGADACIIFQNRNEFKASIFEAKWPRLSTNVDTWDSKQKSSGQSHFHSQLARQHAQIRYLAVWEMFYSEHPFGKQPKHFPPEGSACVWHDVAYAATMARPNFNKPWRDHELDDLLEGNSMTISEVIEAICVCSHGKPLKNGNYQSAFGDAGLPYQALIISFDSKSGD